MSTFIGRLAFLAGLTAPILSQAQMNPIDVRSALDKHSAGPRIEEDGTRKEMPAMTLVQKDKLRFKLQKHDEVIAIDGQAIDPIEGAAKLHTDDSKMKSVTVRRAGKEVILKPVKK